METYIGYYAFLISTIFSLIITHVALYYHRKTISDERVKKYVQMHKK